MGSYPGPCANQGLFSPLLLAATLAPGLMPPNACRGCPHFQIDGTSGVPAACLLPGHKGGAQPGAPCPMQRPAGVPGPLEGTRGGGFFPFPLTGQSHSKPQVRHCTAGGFCSLSAAVMRFSITAKGLRNP